MKKTENINLGGQAFVIDQDAFKVLEKYISNIDRMLRKSRTSSDVLQDIELRIAEIIEEKRENRSIITLSDVEDVQKIMGDPRVFVNDFDSDLDDAKMNGEFTGERRKKRLYRNPEDKVLGGVASGVAEYFGIKESWIMRLIFVFSFFTLGVGVLFYILLWAIIPEAITEEDFKEMRGEPVDFTDIAESVKTEFDKLKRTLTN